MPLHLTQEEYHQLLQLSNGNLPAFILESVRALASAQHSAGGGAAGQQPSVPADAPAPAPGPKAPNMPTMSKPVAVDGRRVDPAK